MFFACTKIIHFNFFNMFAICILVEIDIYYIHVRHVYYFLKISVCYKAYPIYAEQFYWCNITRIFLWTALYTGFGISIEIMHYWMHKTLVIAHTHMVYFVTHWIRYCNTFVKNIFVLHKFVFTTTIGYRCSRRGHVFNNSTR